MPQQTLCIIFIIPKYSYLGLLYRLAYAITHICVVLFYLFGFLYICSLLFFSLHEFMMNKADQYLVGLQADDTDAPKIKPLALNYNLNIITNFQHLFMAQLTVL